MCALSVLPSTLTAVPSSSGSRTDRYSLMCRAGRSKLYPYMSSMTILCDSPMPSTSRPGPAASAAVSACWASTAGCLVRDCDAGDGGTADVIIRDQEGAGHRGQHSDLVTGMREVRPDRRL